MKLFSRPTKNDWDDEEEEPVSVTGQDEVCVRERCMCTQTTPHTPTHTTSHHTTPHHTTSH